MAALLNDKKLCFIGSGNMGEALISGLAGSGAARPENIICTDIRKHKLERITEVYGVKTGTDNVAAVVEHLVAAGELAGAEFL